MRRWLFLGCVSLAACGTEPVENVAATESVSTNVAASGQVPPDTAPSVVKDTTAHPSYAPAAAVKKPSGIYQFLLPYNDKTNILHTVAFYPNTYRLQEEYPGKADSVVVTEGTWAPSQGFIWLYREQLVRGRYAWEGDTLQYYSPRLKRKFSLAKLTPASQNTAWQEKKKQGAVFFGVGTEPFWSVELTAQDTVVLSMPDWPAPVRARITGKTGEKTGILYSATDSLQVLVTPFFCSDGMSDFVYTNRVSVTYKSKTYKGCGASL